MEFGDTKTMCKLENEKTYTRLEIYDNFDCLAVTNQTVTFRKPVYLGFCVLELSAVHMFETYCNML